MSERGSVTLLSLMVVGAVLVAGVVTAGVARVVGVKIQAQTAADAAALAAAPATFDGSDPARAARRLAEANGATLRWCRCRIDRSAGPRSVEVEVVIGVEIPVLGEMAVPARAAAEYMPPSAVIDPAP